MLLGWGLLLATLTASADREGFVLNRYQAPPAVNDGLARSLPTTLGSMRPSVALVVETGNNFLTVEEGGDEIELVRAQINATLVAAIGIGTRLQFALSLPLTLAQGGDDQALVGSSFSEPSSLVAADPQLSASLSLIGEESRSLRVGVEGSAPIPVASEDDFESDGGPGGRVRLLGALLTPPLTTSANVGVAYRPARDFETVKIGSELLFDAGLYLEVFSGIELLGELWGASPFRSSDGASFSEKTPLETLFGFRHAIPTMGLSTAAGLGIGLTDAPGVASLRGVFRVGFTPPVAAARRSPPPPPSPTDSDGDGLMNPEDRCPNEPEDSDGFEDEDGCPEPDNDRDRILDAADRCPREAEDRDSFEDEDGCIDPDNDRDGILDAADRCPLEPESQNGVDDTDGCPETRVVGAQIQIAQRIEFETDRDVLLPASNAILEEVAQILRDNASLRVRVEGHTDNRGDAQHNTSLSRRRAENVKGWFVQHGVDGSRLEILGAGASRPIADNTTPEGQQQNRRVEFHILDQEAPPVPEPQQP